MSIHERYLVFIIHWLLHEKAPLASYIMNIKGFRYILLGRLMNVEVSYRTATQACYTPNNVNRHGFLE